MNAKGWIHTDQHIIIRVASGDLLHLHVCTCEKTCSISLLKALQGGESLVFLAQGMMLRQKFGKLIYISGSPVIKSFRFKKETRKENGSLYNEPVSFLVSLLYRSILSYIEHYGAALGNAIAIESFRFVFSTLSG